MEYSHDLRIPKERIAILIGTKGEVKKEVEEQTKCKIEVDSKEGDVTITSKDAVEIVTAREVVKAIGRGFNPEIAYQLLKPNYMLEIIDIQDYVGKSKKDEIRVKGRIIGTEGKSRKVIEDLTDTYISVYGKTIAIIGEIDHIGLTRRAIESLLAGSPHSTIYAWLEKQRKNLRVRDMM